MRPKSISSLVVLHFYFPSEKIGENFETFNKHNAASRSNSFTPSYWELLIFHSAATLPRTQHLSLLYRKYPDEFHSLIPPVQTFTARNRHATSTDSNHPHSSHFALISSKLYSHSFFPENCYNVEHSHSQMLP